MFKLGIRNELRTAYTDDMILGLKVKGSKVKVTGSQSPKNILMALQPNRLIYNHQTWHRDSSSWVLAHQGQKVKRQGHNTVKHIESDRVAGVSYALYRVPTLHSICYKQQWYSWTTWRGNRCLQLPRTYNDLTAGTLWSANSRRSLDRLQLKYVFALCDPVTFWPNIYLFIISHTKYMSKKVQTIKKIHLHYTVYSRHYTIYILL